MLYLLTYDICKSRVNTVAKICVKYGVRVQNSVFELDVDLSEMKKLIAEIEKVICYEEDSVRIYKIGRRSNNTIKIIGKHEVIEITENHDIIF